MNTNNTNNTNRRTVQIRNPAWGRQLCNDALSSAAGAARVARRRVASLLTRLLTRRAAHLAPLLREVAESNEPSMRRRCFNLICGSLLRCKTPIITPTMRASEIELCARHLVDGDVFLWLLQVRARASVPASSQLGSNRVTSRHVASRRVASVRRRRSCNRTSWQSYRRSKRTHSHTRSCYSARWRLLLCCSSAVLLAAREWQFWRQTALQSSTLTTQLPRCVWSSSI